MPSIDAIFAEDATWPPYDRSLPWEETRDGVTVVIEPKTHFADDMMAFDLCARRYCYYRDWRDHGKDARFFEHISLCGDNIMMRARATIAREINDGLWDRPLILRVGLRRATIGKSEADKYAVPSIL